KAASAFSHGGMVMKVKFGYRKLTKEQATSGEFGPKGLRIQKLVEKTPIIQEMRRRILDNQAPSAVVQWLEDEGVEPPPYAKEWTTRVLIALLRDPILSGRRRFRVVTSKLIYGTGKPRRLRNPEPPEQQEVPSLAHMTPEEQAEIISVLDERARTI